MDVCLHDIGLVYGGDLLAAMLNGVVERELGNASGLVACGDLERLDDPGDGLVLQRAILALGLLADHANVNVVVAELQAGHALDADDMREQVELQPYLLVHRLQLAAFAQRRRGQHALQTASILFKATHQVFHRAASARH